MCVHVRGAEVVVSSPNTGQNELVRHLFRQASSQDPSPRAPLQQALSPALGESGWWQRQWGESPSSISPILKHTLMTRTLTNAWFHAHTYAHMHAHTHTHCAYCIYSHTHIRDLWSSLSCFNGRMNAWEAYDFIILRGIITKNLEIWWIAAASCNQQKVWICSLKQWLLLPWRWHHADCALIPEEEEVKSAPLGESHPPSCTAVQPTLPSPSQVRRALAHTSLALPSRFQPGRFIPTRHVPSQIIFAQVCSAQNKVVSFTLWPDKAIPAH